MLESRKERRVLSREMTTRLCHGSDYENPGLLVNRGMISKCSTTHRAIETPRSRNSKTCLTPGCTKNPHYGVSREIDPTSKALYCSGHKQPGMINIHGRKCLKPGCLKQPRFDHRGGKGQYCADHKLKGMLDVLYTPCAEPGCLKHPHFGLVGEGARFCAKHRTDDMVDVKHPRCHTHGCTELRMIRADGQRAQRCALHEAQVGGRRGGGRRGGAHQSPQTMASGSPAAAKNRRADNSGNSQVGRSGCRKRKSLVPDKAASVSGMQRCLPHQRMVRSRGPEIDHMDSDLHGVGGNTLGNDDPSEGMVTQGGESDLSIEKGGRIPPPAGIQENNWGNSPSGHEDISDDSNGDGDNDKLLLNVLGNLMPDIEEAPEPSSASGDGLSLGIPGAAALMRDDLPQMGSTPSLGEKMPLTTTCSFQGLVNQGSVGDIMPQMGCVPFPHEKHSSTPASSFQVLRDQAPVGGAMLQMGSATSPEENSLNPSCSFQALGDQAPPWGVEDMEGCATTSPHAAPSQQGAIRMGVGAEWGQEWGGPPFLGDSNPRGGLGTFHNRDFSVGGGVQEGFVYEGRAPVTAVAAAATGTSGTESGAAPVSRMGSVSNRVYTSQLMGSLSEQQHQEQQQEQQQQAFQLHRLNSSTVVRQTQHCSALGSPSVQQLGSAGELNISVEDAAAMITAKLSPAGAGSVMTALPSLTPLGPCSLVNSRGGQHQKLRRCPLPSSSPLSLGQGQAQAQAQAQVRGQGRHGGGALGLSLLPSMFAFPLSGLTCSSASQAPSSSQSQSWSQSSLVQADMPTNCFGLGGSNRRMKALESPGSPDCGAGAVFPPPCSTSAAYMSLSTPLEDGSIVPTLDIAGGSWDSEEPGSLWQGCFYSEGI